MPFGFLYSASGRWETRWKTMELAALEMNEFARADPVALVVGDEQVIVRSVKPVAVPRAVRCKPSNVLPSADLDAPTDVGHVPSPALSAEEGVEVILPVDDGTESKRVVIPGIAPLAADRFIQVGLSIPVGIGNASQLRLLHDVDLAADNLRRAVH